MRRYSVYKRIVAVILGSFALQTVLLIGFAYMRYDSGVKQAESTFDALLSTNNERISTRLDTVKSIASSVAFAPDVQEYFFELNANSRVNSYKSIKYLFDTQINSYSCVKGIYVFNEEGVFLGQGNDLYVVEQFKVDIGLTSGELPANSFFSKVYYHPMDEYKDSPFCVYVQPANAIASLELANRKLCCCVVVDITKLLEIDNAENLEFLLYDGELISSNREFWALRKQDIQVENPSLFQTTTIDGVQYYLNSEKLEVEAPLMYMLLVPTDSLLGNVKRYISFSGAMVGVCLVLTTFMLKSLRKSIIQPIQQMTEDMMMVTDADGSVRLTGAKELDILSVDVNNMIGKIREMQKRDIEQQVNAYRLNLEKTQAQMLGYRSQINPHFLFNTLGCVSSMAHLYGIEEMENIITALADNFRYALRAQEYTLVEEEIMHVRNYMQIMNVRYPGKYHLELDVDEAAAKMKMISLTLQPLVENAVQHAFVNYCKEEKRTIIVSAKKEARVLHISVADNGIGLSAADLETVRLHMYAEEMNPEREHIALQNIYRRIRLSYDGRGEITVCSEEGKYTRFDIMIPIA